MQVARQLCCVESDGVVPRLRWYVMLAPMYLSKIVDYLQTTLGGVGDDKDREGRDAGTVHVFGFKQQ